MVRMMVGAAFRYWPPAKISSASQKDADIPVLKEAKAECPMLLSEVGELSFGFRRGS